MAVRTIKATVGELSNMIVPLGVQGDNKATQVRIDYSEWIEDGSSGNPYIEVINPVGTVYGIAVNIEGTELVWDVDNADTATCGEGSFRVVLIGTDGEISQSTSCKTTVTPAYSISTDKPDVVESWLNEIGDLSGTVSTYASAAADSAEAAASSALKAENAVENVNNLNNSISFADTFMTINVAVSDWEAQTDVATLKTVYVYEAANDNITSADIQATLNLDESAEYLEDCLELETSVGKLTLRTDVLPTGTINGTVQLAGKLCTQFSNDTVIERLTTAEETVASAVSTVNAVKAAYDSGELDGADGTDGINADIRQDPDDETGGMIVSGTQSDIDSTLSVSGQAADAKAVGDALADVGNALADVGNALADVGDALADKQDTLIAGDGIEIAGDGKTISATNIEKEWELKATWASADPITVDLTGCTELVICGPTLGTANSGISAYFGTSTYTIVTTSNAVTTTERLISAYFTDTPQGIMPLTFTYVSKASVSSTSGLGGYTVSTTAMNGVYGAKIAGITKFSFSAKANVTSCELKIYAR